MQAQSKICPQVTIDYHQPAPRTAAGFSFMLNDYRLSMDDLKAELKLTPHGVDYLFAEARDLTWPKNTHSVKVIFENGYELATPINGSRLDVLEYYYKNEFNVGHIEDNMQRVKTVIFIK